jgi:hypothetical protein
MSLGLIRRPMGPRTSVASVAPEAAPWYRRAARTEAREMVARWRRRMLQAELERWPLHARPPAARRDRLQGPARGLAARRATKRVLRASQWRGWSPRRPRP